MFFAFFASKEVLKYLFLQFFEPQPKFGQTMAEKKTITFHILQNTGH